MECTPVLFPRYSASHGCIRMPEIMAKRFSTRQGGTMRGVIEPPIKVER